MTKVERVKAARERLAAAQATLEKIQRANVEYQKRQDGVIQRLTALNARLARKPIAVQRPGETILMDRIPISLGWTDGEVAKSCGTNVDKWTTAVAQGDVSISVNSVVMKAKGFVKRTRYVSPADQRAIKRARLAEQKARDAYTKAQTNTRMTILAAWTHGTPVPLDEVAKAIGTAAAIRMSQGERVDKWLVDSRTRDVEVAKNHLEYVLGKADSCSCRDCYDERREQEQEERRKRLLKQPRVQYVCPACEDTVIGYVFELESEPDVESTRCPVCNHLFRVKAIKHRRVAVSKPIGKVAA